MNIITKLTLSVMMVAGMAASLTMLAPQSASAAPRQNSLVVVAHPDDEMQAWSMIENSTDNYKVFVYMTNGEETSSCVPSGYDNSLRTDLGEVPAYQAPQGKFSDECRKSRMVSTLRFINTMGSDDSSIPKGFRITPDKTVNLPDPNNINPGPKDGSLSYTDRYVKVHHSNNGMGSVLFFNLGDGDTSVQEVEWAVKSVIANRATLGLPNLPFHNAIGNYRNVQDGCYKYDHHDHRTVHQALWSHDFGLTGYQAAATCATDPDADQTKLVSTSTWNDAMGIDSSNNYQRTGHFQRQYGWLDASQKGWSHDASGHSQNAIWSRKQVFWYRF